jgi:hypothetical protein
MDILRNIEKKILNIANNNTNDVNSLKKDIKEYLDNFDKQQDINNQKKNKYEELYENKRMLAHISYENYLSIKEDLMKEIKKDKTKGAIRKYLEYKYEASDIPEIYTYQKLSLKNDIVDKIVKPTPPKEPKKLIPTPPKEPKKLIPTPLKEPKKLIPKPPKEPKKLIPTPPKEPKKPSDAILNEPPKEPKKLPKLQKDTKACKDDEEINPKTGKCVKKCKEDEIRNLETGRCNKIKPPKAPKQSKIPTIKK